MGRVCRDSEHAQREISGCAACARACSFLFSWPLLNGPDYPRTLPDDAFSALQMDKYHLDIVLAHVCVPTHQLEAGEWGLDAIPSSDHECHTAGSLGKKEGRRCGVERE